MTYKHELPEWIESRIPAPRPVKGIRYDKDEDVFTVDGEDQTYDSLQVAYDKFNRRDPDYALMLHESVNDSPQVSKSRLCGVEEEFVSMVTLEENIHGGHRVLMSSSDLGRIDLLRYAYDSSREFIDQWQRDKNSQANAYYMISNHPAFWAPMKDDNTHWLTGEDNIRFDNSYDLEKGFTLRLMHQDENFLADEDKKLPDTELVSIGKPTFAEAMMDLAQKVDTIYNADGARKG